MPTGAGKTSPETDTYHGHFARLVPNEQVVEVVEFETTDAAMQGEMKVITTLRDTDGGTEIAVAYEGLPPDCPEAANETGTRMALAKLAALVEPEIAHRQGKWLGQVVGGFLAITPCRPTVGLLAFRYHVTNLWRRTLRRRSQKDACTWARDRSARLPTCLPKPLIRHPWPSTRFAAKPR